MVNNQKTINISMRVHELLENDDMAYDKSTKKMPHLRNGWKIINNSK